MEPKDVVIVTGSSGFIGATLAEHFALRRHVIGFDLAPSRTPSPDIEFIRMDLISPESVKAAFDRVREHSGNRIASVVHLAAYYDLSGEPNPLYEQITVRGTERLLEHLQDFDVEQFIFSSTMLVHAPTEPGWPITENSPLDPRWAYPQSKVETENLIRQKHGRIPFVIARLAGVYDDLCHSAFLSQQIARIYEQQLLSHVYPGDIRRGQAAVHLDDVAVAFSRLIDRRRELPPELTLLIGEPETMSYDAIQRCAGRLIHAEEWETREIPKALAKTGAWLEEEVFDEEPFIRPWMIDLSDDHYELDIAAARSRLGWEPAHSLRRSLPRMIAALTQDPPGWYRVNKLNAARVAADRPLAADEGRKEALTRPEAMREHFAEMRKAHFGALWTHFTNILLGAWLITSPFAFGSFGQTAFPERVAQVTQERGLWEPALRSETLAWSDIASGVLVMLFGALALSRRFPFAQWANTIVGIWLLFAPLVFWAPSPAVYANDTLIGALVITFSILVPMMPGMSHEAMMDKTDTPPGWTYSPSTWLQRLPIIALGALGFFIARQLAAYQFGHIKGVWEPFFTGQGGLNGTEYIITSSVSKAWPIPDGGLGAVTYMFEILMGAMGDRRRWRTMPWMVLLFGVVVVPLGAVSIYFIIIQPIVIGTYCSLCLLAALAMLIMIPLALDELVAMEQFLAQSRRRGEPVWRTFFRGGASPNGCLSDKPGFGASVSGMVASATRGVTIPWTLAASAALGVWLMFSRLVFGVAPPLADSDHLVGALVITVAVIAMAEVARLLRFVNVGFGLWLAAAPWLLSGGSLAAAAADILAGLVLIALSLPRGRISDEHYGGWDRFIV